MTVSSRTTTTLTFSWTQPAEEFALYLLNVDYQGECMGVAIVPPQTSSTREQTYNGLEEFSDYQLSISAFNSAGSATMVVTATTLPAAPSDQVESLQITSTNATSITIQWERVECIKRNSEITGYEVSYRLTTDTDGITTPVSGTDSRTFTASGLIPGARYVLEVVPVSGSGNGNSRNVQMATDPATGIMLVGHVGIMYCIVLILQL